MMFDGIHGLHKAKSLAMLLERVGDVKCLRPRFAFARNVYPCGDDKELFEAAQGKIENMCIGAESVSVRQVGFDD
jgi:hypothetical protein